MVTSREQFAAWEGSVEELKGLVTDRALTGETMLLNMGPQHPSTHGVLRLLLELDGEEVVTCIPDVGYLHTGIEKNMEYKTYEKSIVMTDRMDYLSPMGNNLVYCLAMEKLFELDVPRRAAIARVILAELTRLASHMVWLGIHGLDLGVTSTMIYCFREREKVLDIYEMCGGQRMMSTYFRPGGLWRDLPDEFVPAVNDILEDFPRRIDDYESLLTNNRMFMERTQGIGFMTAEDAVNYGLSGATLRASGVNWDIRKAQPYSLYDEFDFDVPLGQHGDVYDRYLVRMGEMRQSLRIIRQGLDKLAKEKGPFRSDNRKYVPPPRAELGRSMEAVIHHFKLWTEGFRPPKGEVYAAIESPRGELGCFLASDGSPKPMRVHFRTPSFVHIGALSELAKGYMIADLVAIIGSVDIVLGDCDR
ncbi:MAG: NADH-quinone oxidoreductase subunit D [Anaerolineae bacterium]|jgi:NADH-quinone oxidoreductase subunit D|nr:MAG: NADH-quinone oxidoreductase subunit D [Anaerolineae bacterium]MCL4880238.1 NADH-quinone oxidoreductase subunit D [Anaerolineae bacterium]